MNPQTRDIGAYIAATKGIKPQSTTAATINGPAIDRVGKYSCVLQGSCGDATGSPSAQSVTHKLQHSADGSTGWTDLADAAAAALTANDTAVEVDVDLSGALRYIRAVAVVAFTAGTSPAIPIAATVVLGGSDTLPI